ncbi:MAG: hypothetical protein IKG18_14855 [Atopobiaceae bacterium]|nr:hypothetical protein [Atopobiaceae bacterium]
MNPFVKSAITFVVVFVAAIAYTYVSDTVIGQEVFHVDLAVALGAAAGGAVIMLVHDLTKDE